MTVHIHIYEGDNGPVQPRPPIQRPPAPRPPMPVPTGEAGKMPMDNLVAAERAMQAKEITKLREDNQNLEKVIKASGERIEVEKACLLALARHVTGLRDPLGGRIMDDLQQSGKQANATLMDIIAKAYEEWSNFNKTDPNTKPPA